MRRRSAALAVVLAVVGSLAFGGARAWAHNGLGAAFKGRAGPYTVYAYDGYPSTGTSLTYRLVVLVAKTGGPASDLRVAVSAARAGESVRAPAQLYANVVFYELRNPYPHSWRVSVRVSGAEGSGTAAFSMHGVAPTAAAPTGPAYAVGATGGGSSWPWVAGGVALAVALAAVVLVYRRR